jgi:hypothetical protein
MRKSLLALAALTTVLVAATPGPSPVITLEGVSAAAKLSPELRATLAPQIEALNARLEKMVAIKGDASKASEQERAYTNDAMKDIHEIVKQLDPEQRAAFFEYLHGQMKSAGIHMTHPPHGERDHPPHGDKTHPHRGGTHGDPWAAAA